MKVLIVNPILSTIEKRGGKHSQPPLSTTMIHTLCMGFVNQGHDLTLATASDFRPESHNDDDYPYKTLFFRGNLKSIALPDRIPLSIEFFRFLKKNHRNYDLIIVSEIFQFYSLAAALVCPQKTIVWQEMTSHQRIFKSIPSKLWHRIIVPTAFRKIIGVIPRSLRARRFISKYTAKVSDYIVNNPVNGSLFSPSQVKKRQLISYSRLTYSKGIDHIIRKFAKFHEFPGYEDIKLVIAGRGEASEDLKRLADELNIRDSVIFTGQLWHRELATTVAESIALLVATRKDLNMVATSESLCACTPVLTNTVPASVSFIESNEVGIVKDDWDEHDIKTIVDNADLMCSRCHDIRSTLTAEYAVGKFIEVKHHSPITAIKYR
ncbi:MAG: glycosyltransferase [Paramuribaculum sp.]|nr:glycosyltransferase [Paramuribaculum sp.]